MRLRWCDRRAGKGCQRQNAETRRGGQIHPMQPGQNLLDRPVRHISTHSIAAEGFSRLVRCAPRSPANRLHLRRIVAEYGQTQSDKDRVVRCVNWRLYSSARRFGPICDVPRRGGCIFTLTVMLTLRKSKLFMGGIKAAIGSCLFQA